MGDAVFVGLLVAGGYAIEAVRVQREPPSVRRRRGLLFVLQMVGFGTVILATTVPVKLLGIGLVICWLFMPRR
jgi:hypothetical protein